MEILSDPPKRRSNIARHGFDFDDLDEAFFENAVEWPSTEGRIVAVGRLNGVVVVAVVYRPYGSEAISVISMRFASRKERRKYHDEIERRSQHPG